jgi:DNA-binding PadR family transcriptional regulator
MKYAKLGEFEELVLLTVASLGEAAYGLSVQQRLTHEARRPVELATVHSALYRLEDKGFLSSELGGATAERGGRRKRLFTPTGAGWDALQAARAVRERLWHLILNPSP